FLSLGFIILGQKALTPCYFVSKFRPFLVVPQPFAALLSVKTGICRGQGAGVLHTFPSFIWTSPRLD
ncbi:TPA: hypothetical protein ACSP3H_003782, partial [Aeromonas veronii]